MVSSLASVVTILSDTLALNLQLPPIQVRLAIQEQQWMVTGAKARPRSGGQTEDPQLSIQLLLMNLGKRILGTKEELEEKFEQENLYVLEAQRISVGDNEIVMLLLILIAPE
ncbi:hypothetical protein AK812_SmicGene3625 [Symbiodinium microadriaticum]|uniref:Uncharacterized protein n=1 Tax=Symbiodinium microadriaticum TaxID=2951 RepID=A0A1Q9EYJ1_SYMMI|nr:hypothetical protein AK812_SmicGene3625 [Symbiodinium microadriaticum]